MSDELETREKLLKSAMAEFSEKGYMKASLRKICADAGVTTGALYFFFKNKNDLFSAIVDPPLKEISRLLEEHYLHDADEFQYGSPEVMTVEYQLETHGEMDGIVEYLYKYRNVFTLLLTRAQGSEYENAVDMMVEMTEKGYRISAEKMLEKMEGYHIDEYMLHWQSHTNVDAFIHLLTHESDVERAKKHMKRIMEYLVRGWFCIVVPDEPAE